MSLCDANMTRLPTVTYSASPHSHSELTLGPEGSRESGEQQASDEIDVSGPQIYLKQ